MVLDIRTGDVFCVDSGSAISRSITIIETLWSSDNSATYNHAGIIIDNTGQTFEALWRARVSNLNRYIGKQILIARPVTNLAGHPVHVIEKRNAIRILMDNQSGKFYPVHRLLFFLIKPLAKYLSTGAMRVCSEQVTYYLKRIMCWSKLAPGINPDELADSLIHEKYYQVIFEGVWK